MIRVIGREKRSLTDFFGKWPEPKELDIIEKELEGERKKTKMRNVDFSQKR